MTDDLEDRLRAADPAQTVGTERLSPSWISHLTEDIMNDTSTAQRSRWQLPAVAAAVLVLGIGGYAVAQSNGLPAASQPTAAAPPMKLVTGTPGPGANLCVRLTPSILRQVPVAFSGTVAHVGPTSILIAVDHWYRGGHASQVVVSSPDGKRIIPEGVVPLTAGKRYLVTASHGVVMGCGFTVAWTAPAAGLFERAFH